ncbi:MAG: TolC family protein [Bacteroidetes bacterium]|nr:TolC family protein [Bacteroidota bacterium]
MKQLLALMIFMPALLSAQELLTPEEALRIGMKNNYDILLTRNAADAAALNNSPGAAGMLPDVSINAAASKNQSNIQQRFANGNEISSPNAGGQNYSAGIALGWTVFDGMRMFATRERLEQLATAGEYTWRAQVQRTAADILSGYFNIVRLGELLKATQEVIAVNEERVRITENRVNSGLAARNELLQARIDLNVQQENLISLQLSHSLAKQQLNQLLARDALLAFAVIETIPDAVIENRAQLQQKILSSNPELLAFQARVNAAGQTVREARAAYMPVVRLNGGYNFGRTENAAGFSLFNQSYGWQGGVTLAMPLYSGGNVKRNVATNRLQFADARYQAERASQAVSLQLHNALQTFDARASMLTLEHENENMSRENIKIALDRLRLGQGTSLDVKEAQATLAQCLTRSIQARFDLKMAEVSVKQLAGEL